jgi:mycofactocin precursor
MPGTNLQNNEATIIMKEAKDLSSLEDPSNVTLEEPSVNLSEAKDLSSLEAPEDEDTLELDLALEEELIIEDFTIDGICGVY